MFLWYLLMCILTICMFFCVLTCTAYIPLCNVVPSIPVWMFILMCICILLLGGVIRKVMDTGRWKRGEERTAWRGQPEMKLSSTLQSDIYVHSSSSAAPCNYTLQSQGLYCTFTIWWFLAMAWGTYYHQVVFCTNKCGMFRLTISSLVLFKSWESITWCFCSLYLHHGNWIVVVTITDTWDCREGITK